MLVRLMRRLYGLWAFLDRIAKNTDRLEKIENSINSVDGSMKDLVDNGLYLRR